MARRIKLLLVALIYILVGCTDGQPSRKLTAHVAFADGYFQVTNKDNFDWETCDLDLNGDYQIKIARLAWGRTAELRPGEFTKPTGERFNLLTTKPLRLHIYCRNTPHGVLSTLVGWQ